MTLNNQQIYNYALSLRNCFGSDVTNIRLPIKINFFLQKNIRTLSEAANEIELSRLAIAQAYGAMNEDGSGYIVPQEKIIEANQDLNELFALEQDIPLHMFKLDDFGDIELSYQQMNAIMFMIEE